MRLASRCFLFSIWMCASTGIADEEVVLLEDDFSGYRAGLFSSVAGAHTEYHYLREAAPQGNWEISTFRSSVPSQRAWRIVDHDGSRAMAQFYKNKFRHYHPMIVAGDPAWQDYSVKVHFIPQTDDRMAGLIFRYRNDRCYYFCGVQNGKAVLKVVRHATGFREPFEKILASRPLDAVLNTPIDAEVTVEGDRMAAQLNDVLLTAENGQFRRGRIGLIADGPTIFQDVLVTATSTEAQRVARTVQERQSEEHTQRDNRRSGRLFAPRRNPLYNYSNYQTTVSLPGWSE